MIFRNVFIMSFIVVALLFGCTSKSDQMDVTAADFTLQDMSGNNVKLSHYRGKVVLLEFWATWCPPCRASIPGIEKMYKSLKDKGFVVLAVSMDEGDWNSVESFVRSYGITYPVLKGTDDVASKYRVRTIPLLLILDREGKISKRYLGFGMEDDLEKDVKALL